MAAALERICHPSNACLSVPDSRCLMTRVRILAYFGGWRLICLAQVMEKTRAMAIQSRRIRSRGVEKKPVHKRLIETPIVRQFVHIYRALPHPLPHFLVLPASLASYLGFVVGTGVPDGSNAACCVDGDLARRMSLCVIPRPCNNNKAQMM